MSARFGESELRRAMVAALGALRAHQAAIDEANVFPVPDGDTGTNLVLTMSAAVAALSRPEPFAAVPQAALVGARGNSGVVLSQILRGFCERARDGGPDEVKAALREAADLAYRSVLEPVEGTMLSVIRAAGLHAEGDTVVEVLDSAARAARRAVEHTPAQLPMLAEAGVLDAGGIGVWVLLDAMAAALGNRDPAAAPEMPTTPRTAVREAGSARFGFEVQYVLEAPEPDVDELRAALGAIGDSVVVSGGGGLWNVHVHTNDTDEAVAIGMRAGVVRAPAVTAFADRGGGSRAVPVARSLSPVTVVAVVAGDGFASLYAELGAGVLVDGGPTMNPSVGDIADGIRRAPAGDVIVLPNNPDAVPAARQACSLVGERNAVVVETRDLAHGVTTMLAYGDARDLDTNAAQMRQAAMVASTAAVVVAARDAVTPAGPVRAGESLGLIAGIPVYFAGDPVAVVVEIAHRLDAEEPIEVLTVFAGADAPDEERADLEKRLRDAFVGVDVEVRDGGQPVERYLVAVE